MMKAKQQQTEEEKNRIQFVCSMIENVDDWHRHGGKVQHYVAKTEECFTSAELTQAEKAPRKRATTKRERKREREGGKGQLFYLNFSR